MEAILIGFMGSGKTTVGQLLAQRLQTAHADLDDLIVQAAGRPITQIFAEHGEPYFRGLEQQTLRQAMQGAGVLSTGGGTPTVAANTTILTHSPIPVIWLQASDATILKRVTGDTQRPLVNELKVDELLALKHRRERLYAAAADLIMPTDALTPVKIVQAITDWLAQPQVHRA